MSDSNSPRDVAMQQDPGARLARENQELRERLAALEHEKIVEGRFSGEAPRYLLNEPIYIEDTFYATGTVLETFEPPNLAMVPQNEPARIRMQEHIERLEQGARRVAALRGRDFTGLVTDRGVLLADALRDAKDDANAPIPVIQMPQPHGSVPAMPHTDEARALAKRGPGRPRKVLSAQPPGPIARPQGVDMGAPVLAPAPGDRAVLGRAAG